VLSAAFALILAALYSVASIAASQAAYRSAAVML
jgi:hypothetical protein